MLYQGYSKWPEYKIWWGIKSRCYTKSDTDYRYYGGVGIRVCRRWRESFWNFIEDVGRRPFPKAEIDRIDNSEDYQPGNCRWVAHLCNSRNRPQCIVTTDLRERVKKECDFSYGSRVAIARKYGISRDTVRRILKGYFDSDLKDE